MRDLFLLGGGGHARVVAEVARACSARYRLAGYVDPSLDPEAVRVFGVPRLDDDAALAQHQSVLAIVAVVAFGGARTSARRRAAVDRVSPLIEGWATLVHPTAYVSPTATLGVGTVVMAGAIVQANARVGAHCVINSGAVVEHQVVIGDFVEVCPAAAIGGGTTIGDDAYIGLRAAVRDHVHVGRGALVAMGAVVVGDVPADADVRGVPAR